MIVLSQPDLKCKFNPMGIMCDGRTICSFCGWNPAENKKRKEQIRRKEMRGEALKCVVKKPYREDEPL